jgi:outer membrane autotransporter protein
MKRVIFLLIFVAAIAAWCTLSFAVGEIRQTATVSEALNDGTGAGVESGVKMGVDMTGNVTLTVGTQDIFTTNTSLATTPLAVSSADNMGRILFNGSSTVHGNIGQLVTTARVLYITAGDSAIVNFLGQVYTTDLSVGNGTVYFKSGLQTSGSSNSARMNFTGEGTISLAANTEVIGALTTNTNGTGTLELYGGSKLIGAVTGLKTIRVTGGSDTAGVVGTIEGAATDIHSFDLSTNELYVKGGILTIFTDGVIDTRVAAPTLYGHILVEDGYASHLGTGLTVKVTVAPGTTIPLGTLFDIVRSTTGTGAPYAVDYAAALGYEFKVAISTDGDAVILTTKVADAQAVPVAAPLAALVAAAATSPDLLDVLSSTNALSGSAQDNAVAQLAPSTPSLAAPLVTFQGTRQFQNLWSSHLDMCSQVSEPNENNPNCRGNEQRSGWWMKGFGYAGNQDARDNSTGYDSKIIGGMVAFDAPLDAYTRAGLGFGYARSTIDGDKFDASTDFDTYRPIAFIGHEDGPWFVNGSASFGWSEYSSMRHIVYTGVDRTAKAEYSGQDYTAFASTGYHFSAKEVTITPLASLLYSRVHLNGYTETGAGDINLKANSQDYDFLESGLGVKMERYFSNRDGTSYVPEGHFNWFHELLNPSLEQTAKYTAAGSSSFTTQGLNTADDTFNVGGGITFLSCACSATTWSLEGVYDHYWSNAGYSANQVMVRFTSRF